MPIRASSGTVLTHPPGFPNFLIQRSKSSSRNWVKSTRFLVRIPVFVGEMVGKTPNSLGYPLFSCPLASTKAGSTGKVGQLPEKSATAETWTDRGIGPQITGENDEKPLDVGAPSFRKHHLVEMLGRN